MIKRALESLVGGVIIQAALLLTMYESPRLIPDGSTLNVVLALLNLVAMPGIVLLWPQATPDDAHPGFSVTRLILAIAIDLAFYSIIVYFALALWRARPRSGKRGESEDRHPIAPA